jgi:two-component SAPR family response regulator
MDIDMQFLNGIETARRIRRFDDRVQIVFITRMVSHALEGYEVQAADYLIKPVSYELFRVKMDRIFRKMEQEMEPQ